MSINNSLKIKQFYLPEMLIENNFFQKGADGVTYKFLEGLKFTQEAYEELNEIEKATFMTMTNPNGTPVYTVTNGIVSKLIATAVPDGAPAQYEYYSPNLIKDTLCYNLNIHSLPGNKFMINDTPSNIIRIGASGVFNMDFGNDPIYSIRILDNNEYNLYGTTLDVLYLTNNEETLNALKWAQEELAYV